MTIEGFIARIELAVGRIINCLLCDNRCPGKSINLRQKLLSVFIITFTYAPVNCSAGILDWFFPPETPPKIATAISTTANLAEPLTRDILNKKFVRLSPGSRLLVMDRVDQASAKLLALSVEGAAILSISPGEREST